MAMQKKSRSKLPTLMELSKWQIQTAQDIDVLMAEHRLLSRHVTQVTDVLTRITRTMIEQSNRRMDRGGVYE